MWHCFSISSSPNKQFASIHHLLLGIPNSSSSYCEGGFIFRHLRANRMQGNKFIKSSISINTTFMSQASYSYQCESPERSQLVQLNVDYSIYLQVLSTLTNFYWTTLYIRSWMWRKITPNLGIVKRDNWAFFQCAIRHCVADP